MRTCWPARFGSANPSGKFRLRPEARRGAMRRFPRLPGRRSWGPALCESRRCAWRKNGTKRFASVSIGIGWSAAWRASFSAYPATSAAAKEFPRPEVRGHRRDFMVIERCHVLADERDDVSLVSRPVPRLFPTVGVHSRRVWAPPLAAYVGGDLRRIHLRAFAKSCSVGAPPNDGECRLDTKCKACNSLPSGIIGHRDLFSESLNSRSVVFSCSHRGARWVRAYAAEGAYSWTELSAPDRRPHAAHRPRAALSGHAVSAYARTGPPTAFHPECPLSMYRASNPASRSFDAVVQPTWNP